jgi:hypothetical protein
MGLMPDRPSMQLRQNSSLPIPMGLTIPMPVTTIRSIVYQDTAFMESTQVPPEGVRQTAVISRLIVDKNLCSVFLNALPWCLQERKQDAAGGITGKAA